LFALNYIIVGVDNVDQIFLNKKFMIDKEVVIDKTNNRVVALMY